jgi:hypothetical protein
MAFDHHADEDARSPAAICRRCRLRTSGWFSGFLLLLAWLASIISLAAAPTAASLQAASTLAAS